MAIRIIIDKNSMDASLDTNLLITELITGTHVDKNEVVKMVEGLPTTIESSGFTIRRKDGGMTIEINDIAVSRYNTFMVKWAPALVNAFKAMAAVVKAYVGDYKATVAALIADLKYDGVDAETYIQNKMDEALKAAE